MLLSVSPKSASTRFTVRFVAETVRLQSLEGDLPIVGVRNIETSDSDRAAISEFVRTGGG